MQKKRKFTQRSTGAGNLTKAVGMLADFTLATPTRTKISDLLAMPDAMQVELEVPNFRDLAQAAKLSQRVD